MYEWVGKRGGRGGEEEGIRGGRGGEEGGEERGKALLTCTFMEEGREGHVT